MYVGEWKAGKRNGSGQIYFNEKLEFDGLFSKGLKQGYGK